MSFGVLSMSARRQIDRSAPSFDILRSRVRRLFSHSRMARNPRQMALPLCDVESVDFAESTSLESFFDFLSASLPQCDIYLFGGMLRDLALFGREGFNSDIDVVVEGEWAAFSDYLETLGAKKNRFGGYRLSAGDWPIDIWNAQ